MFETSDNRVNKDGKGDQVSVFVVHPSRVSPLFVKILLTWTRYTK